jgi:hypothetical protein
MTIRKVSQEELRKNIKNLFLLASVGSLRTIDLWNKIEKQSSGKLIKFKQYLKEFEGDIQRGVETRTHLDIPLQSTFILRDSLRAKGLRDSWIVTKNDGTNIFCQNRRTGESLKVPLSALVSGLRRFSGLSTMDISRVLDFIVVRSFRKIEAFMDTNEKEKIVASLPLWKKYVNNRLTNFIIARRFGLSRPGTRLLAYFSSVYAAPSGVLWSIRGISDDDAKILTIWFNSSINILQLFLNRVETSGPWMELHEYVLNDISILDPRALSEAQRTRILDTFDKVKKRTFPSIYNQISNGFWGREEIDHTILLVFGFGAKEAKNLSNVVRHALAGELANLVRLERKKL